MYDCHFQTKQLSVGQHDESMWPTWSRFKICGEIFRPQVKILIVWIPIEMKNSPNNCKSALPAKVNH